jgi:hypothetical protein
VAKLPDSVLTNILTIHQLDIVNLILDETIALVDRDLLQQRRARLLYKSNYIPTQKIES